MKLINSSKFFHSRKTRNLSSKFKLPNHSPMSPLPSSSFNLQLYSSPALLQPPPEFHNHHYPPPSFPYPRLNLRPINKPDLLLSVEKIEKETIHTILQSFSRSQLLQILEEAAIVHPNILHTVLSMIDDDPSHRKLFVRSLGPCTTSKSLREFFSRYGVVEEAKVVLDKATGNSQGFGFVTFANIEGFLLALQNPSKKIEGFVSFSSLCVGSDSSSKKTSGGGSVPNWDDKLKRTIRVENVPAGMSSEILLGFFGKYGEIQEFDMQTGESKGFAYFLYQNEETAKEALAEPCKTIAGFTLFVKKAKEKETRSKIGLGEAQPVPLPLRFLCLPFFYYYYFHCFRGLATYNRYQSELALGGGGECGAVGVAGPASSTMCTVTSGGGGADPRPEASLSGKT